MGATTFQIETQEFKALNTPNENRWAYTFLADAPVYMNNIYHPPGVNGNIVIRNGRTAKRFVATAIYVGDLPTILTAYEADAELFAYGPMTIKDDNGMYWKRCYLEGMNRERPQGTILPGWTNTNGAFFMVHMQFTCHGSVSQTSP